VKQKIEKRELRLDVDRRLHFVQGKSLPFIRIARLPRSLPSGLQSSLSAQ